MASKKKRPSRLGRGLSSLMATTAESPAVPIQPKTEPAAAIQKTTHSGGASTPTAETPTDKSANPKTEPATPKAEDLGGLRHLPIADIQPNRHQPRQKFDSTSLEGLASSIKNDGMMQPIVVRKQQGGEPGTSTYELIAGERRWRAAKLAGLATVPAMVHELDDEQSAQWALVENLQREDLNPIEKAEAFKRLADEFNLPHAKIAERVGLERSTVTNLLRLLALSDFCRDLVREGLLSMGQARAIAGLPDPASQKAVAQQAVRQGLSVRQVETAVRNILQSSDINISPASKPTPKNSLADMERQISEQLGTRVKIKQGRKKGSGTLGIEFFSLDEFDALMSRLDVKME